MLGKSGIRVSSLLSALLCIACISVLVIKHIKGKKQNSAKDYTPVFVDGFEEVINPQTEDNENKEVE